MRFRSKTFTSFLFVVLLTSVIAGTATASFEDLSLDATIKGGDLLSLDATEFSSGNDATGRIESVQIGDKQISEVWEDVPSLAVSSYGEAGSISSIYDGSSVYFLITYDLSVAWTAIQWDSDNSSDADSFNEGDFEPMAIGDDMWIFGDAPTTGVVGDAMASGAELPFAVADEKNDLYWERISVNDTDGTTTHYAWEIKRSLVTGDDAGNDVIFRKGYNLNLLLASDVHHRPDNNVVYMKFTMSDTKVGGDAPVVTEDESADVEVTRVGPYLFTHFAWALLIGVVVFAISNVTSVYIMKENANQ